MTKKRRTRASRSEAKKKEVMKLATKYRKKGLSASRALKKAWKDVK